MSKTIMIVDDSASVRRVVGIALKGAGYTVIEGSDGRDALAKLTGQKVHLIIVPEGRQAVASLPFHTGHHADDRVGRV